MSFIDITDLLSVRYKKNGRTLNGLDCYGLALLVSERFGNKLPDFEYDDTTWETFLSIQKSINLSDYGMIKGSSPYKEGDLLLFKVDCPYENHCGIYLGDDTIIHCNRFGVHVQTFEDYPYEIGSVYRWL